MVTGAKLQLHAPTVERMRESYSKRGMELNEARLRMATLPMPSEVCGHPSSVGGLPHLSDLYCV